MGFKFENLEIWKVAVRFALKIYQITDRLPQRYQFDLGSQLRKSSLSVSNNIAEGSGASSIADFKRFLDIAVKSIFETVSALVILEKRNLISSKEKEGFFQEGELLVKRIRAFKNKLKAKN